MYHSKKSLIALLKDKEPKSNRPIFSADYFSR